LLRDPFTPDDFEAFVGERQRTLQQAIKHLLIKERLDLSPRLRGLDAEVEEVELSLRKMIAASLDNQAPLLPSHILQKADERVAHAGRKNAAFDNDSYASLSGKLQYLDLRELQDVITNKVLWSRFQPRFPTKEALATNLTSWLS
jgi:hypothetical protein